MRFRGVVFLSLVMLSVSWELVTAQTAGPPRRASSTYRSPFPVDQAATSSAEPAGWQKYSYRQSEQPQRQPSPPIPDPYAESKTMNGIVGLASLLQDHEGLPPPKVAQRRRDDAGVGAGVTVGDPGIETPMQRLPDVFQDEPVGPLEQYVFENDPSVVPAGRLSAYKSGFFQKLALTGTWLANGSNPDDLGMTEIESSVTVAVPFPIREWPMLITPAFNIRLLQGPRVTDLPARLYETYVDFMWVPQFLPRLKGLIAVTPSYYSDFQRGDSAAFRIQGKALGIYDWFPDRLQLVFGLLYLDRDDVVMLPAGGVIWTPNDWIRWELIFPRPKLASRVNVGYGYEDWLYFTCEWGGNTYSIERLSGVSDVVTWQDFRLLGGVERKMNGGAGFRVEGGYVIGRSVKYGNGVGDFTPDNTWLIRGGVTF